PRPPRRPASSRASAWPPGACTAANRASSGFGARRPQPRQRRSGLEAPRASTSVRLPLLLPLGGRGHGRRPRRLLVGEARMRGQRAEARARHGGVHAALAVPKDGGASSELAVALAVEGRGGLLLVERALALDVDAPAGEPGRQPGVHALLADGQRELVVGHDDRGLAVLVVDVYLPDPGRLERAGDEARRLVVPRDDVDLLPAELADHHAHA